jgi:hypothetical protein
MTFRVIIDDNFHYMDESARGAAGEFATLAEALGAAQKIVDDCLASAFHTGISAEELGAGYTMFGEDPFIVSTDVTGVAFSAREYARQRVAELCGAREQSAAVCECASGEAADSVFGTVRGFDDIHGCKVRVLACRHCRRRWLRYFVELPRDGNSARWWRAPLGPDDTEAITPERARTYLQSSTWCFVSEGARARRQEAPIAVL